MTNKHIHKQDQDVFVNAHIGLNGKYSSYKNLTFYQKLKAFKEKN